MTLSPTRIPAGMNHNLTGPPGQKGSTQMSDSDTSLKSLRESAAALNKLTDEANEAVSRAEITLNEFGVGSGEYILVKDADSEPRKGHTQYLECRRVNNRHRVCVVWTKAGSLQDETLKPWSDCTRTEKLETVKKLPELLTRIIKVVRSQLTMAQEAKPAVDRVRQILGVEEEGE